MIIIIETTTCVWIELWSSLSFLTWLIYWDCSMSAVSKSWSKRELKCEENPQLSDHVPNAFEWDWYRVKINIGIHVRSSNGHSSILLHPTNVCSAFNVQSSHCLLFICFITQRISISAKYSNMSDWMPDECIQKCFRLRIVHISMIVTGS